MLSGDVFGYAVVIVIIDYSRYIGTYSGPEQGVGEATTLPGTLTENRPVRLMCGRTINAHDMVGSCSRQSGTLSHEYQAEAALPCLYSVEQCLLVVA